MRDFPTQKLNPKIKNVWRINDAIWITLIFLCCFIPFGCIALFDLNMDWAYLICAVILAAYIVSLLIFILILPPIRYIRWRYDLSDEFLDIAKGIIWRKRYVIPFIRVQNTDTRQGPIMRIFGLASVTISTAAGAHEIPGLKYEEAEVLRDHAAELARIAREDV